jgi:adenylosuccinate synthase
MPSDAAVLQQMLVYEESSGWQQSTQGLTEYNASLMPNAYVDRIAQAVAEVSLISRAMVANTS